MISALEKQRGPLPFTSPRVVDTNVQRSGCSDKIAWIVFAFEEAEPLAGASIWNAGQADKEWDTERIASLRKAIPNLCTALAALEQVTPTAVRRLGIHLRPPHIPHGETRVPRAWTEFIRTGGFVPRDAVERCLDQLRDLPFHRQRVLGQGDFEVSHLHIRGDGTVVLVDNEFGGWYPRLDSLTYCYHRLWANRRRPDLARELLGTYVEMCVPHRTQGRFFTEFYRTLLPRALRGVYFDATRRKLGPQHENQALRRKLVEAILARNWRAFL